MYFWKKFLKLPVALLQLLDTYWRTVQLPTVQVCLFFQPQDRRRAVLHSLSEFFGPEALDPLEYSEKNWNDEPYNGGCPVSVGTPGMMTMIAPALRDPHDRCVMNSFTVIMNDDVFVSVLNLYSDHDLYITFMQKLQWNMERTWTWKLAL